MKPHIFKMRNGRWACGVPFFVAPIGLGDTPRAAWEAWKSHAKWAAGIGI